MAQGGSWNVARLSPVIMTAVIAILVCALLAGFTDISAGANDSSNRRFGGDVAVTVPELRGARLHYAVMFEDIRRAAASAIRRDADHLFGLELAALGPAHHGHGRRLLHDRGPRASQRHQAGTEQPPDHAVVLHSQSSKR